MGNEDSLSTNVLSSKELFSRPDEFLSAALSSLLLDNDNDPRPIPREIVIANMGIKLNQRDTHIVIKKLIKDGYADEIKGENGQSLGTYYITFEGAKFINDGGYITASQNVRKQNRIAERNEKLLIVGSLTAGLGAILLFSEDFLKHCAVKGYRWLVSTEILQFWILLALGIAIGIVITVLLNQALKALNK